MKKIVLTGGGTAGHVTPNIALLPSLKEAGFEITYMGSYDGIEKKLIEDLDIPYVGISTGKFRRYFDPKNFTDPFRVIKGLREAKKFLKDWQTQIKTVENDGYSAVQVGFVEKKDRIVNKDANGKKEVIHRHGVNKAEQGHFKKAGTTSKRYVREFKFENAEEYTLGAEIKADIFAEGDKIDASAISKGKGF